MVDYDNTHLKIKVKKWRDIKCVNTRSGKKWEKGNFEQEIEEPEKGYEVVLLGEVVGWGIRTRKKEFFFMLKRKKEFFFYAEKKKGKIWDFSLDKVHIAWFFFFF